MTSPSANGTQTPRCSAAAQASGDDPARCQARSPVPPSPLVVGVMRAGFACRTGRCAAAASARRSPSAGGGGTSRATAGCARSRRRTRRCAARARAAPQRCKRRRQATPLRQAQKARRKKQHSGERCASRALAAAPLLRRVALATASNARGRGRAAEAPQRRAGGCKARGMPAAAGTSARRQRRRCRLRSAAAACVLLQKCARHAAPAVERIEADVASYRAASCGGRRSATARGAAGACARPAWPGVRGCAQEPADAAARAKGTA